MDQPGMEEGRRYHAVPLAAAGDEGSGSIRPSPPGGGRWAAAIPSPDRVRRRFRNRKRRPTLPAARTSATEDRPVFHRRLPVPYFPSPGGPHHLCPPHDPVQYALSLSGNEAIIWR